MSAHSHLLTIAFVSSTAALIVAAPTLARQNLMQTAQNTAVQQSGSNSYRQKNFIGDQRGGDLYRYNHQSPRDPWDSYRKTLQDANMKAKQTNVRQNPTPNGAAGLMSGYNLGGVGSAAQAIPSVRGALLNGSGRSGSGMPVNSVTGSVINTGVPQTTETESSTKVQADNAAEGYTTLTGNYEPSGHGPSLPVPGLVDEGSTLPPETIIQQSSTPVSTYTTAPAATDGNSQDSGMSPETSLQATPGLAQ